MLGKIVFTGGGSAGHVTPNQALIEAFGKLGWEMAYIGSATGIEKSLITAMNIPFYTVKSGKLRRYFSWQNFSDPFKMFFGIFQSWRLIRRIRPDVIFSKGGFVAVPVVIAAWFRRVPVVAHESDFSPGLANRLCFPFVKKICVNFDTAAAAFRYPEKTVTTGTPIRQALFEGQKAKGLSACGFDAKKPCILVIGGSLGADVINQTVRAALESLAAFQVIHICGEGKVDSKLENHPAYRQFTYVEAGLADLFAAADVVVSRAGANALFEILALHKPNLLIPLSRKVSRGDQLQNAAYFQKLGVSYVLEEEDLNQENFVKAIHELMNNKAEIIQKIAALGISSATETVMNVIQEQCHVKQSGAL